MSESLVGEFYNSIADSYDALRFSRPYFQQVDKLERSYVRARVRPDSAVLEIGPGTGRITVELVKKASTVTAVDVSERMIEKLRQKIDSSRLITRHLNVEHIDTLQNYGEFDTVICMRVLPHLEDPVSALTKMRRAVREGGNVVFDLWNIYSFIGVIRKLFRRPSYVLTRFYSYRQMLKIVDASGLTIDDKITWGYPRIGRYSLDRVGRRICQPAGYSIIFNASRKSPSYLMGNLSTQI